MSSLEDEAREQEAPLTAGELALDPMPVHSRDERPAQLDPRLHTCEPTAAPRFGQAWGNAVGRASAILTPDTTREEDHVGKRIDCECGEVVKAETDDELVAKVEQHVSAAHPELVGKMTREDVLGMAVEDD